MSTPPPTAAPSLRPDPQQDRPATSAPAPSRTASLLNLLRRLVDYGKDIAKTLHQRTAATDLFLVTLAFRTDDIPLILARITRGLLRAAALEARFLKRLAAEEKRPAASGTPEPPRPPRAARPADRRAKPAEEDPRLARLPTPEAIAADVRRRPIGAVLADICRDLGMTAGHPLWQELNDAIEENHGNATALLLEMFGPRSDRPAETRRIVPPMPPGWTPPPVQSFLPPMPPGWQPPARPQPGAASGTGPPDPAARNSAEA